SSQDNCPSLFKFSDISSNDCVEMKIAPLPRSAPPPPILLKTDSETTSSANVPPIAVEPFPISSQVSPLKDPNASSRILQLSANATIATLVRSDILVPFKILILATNPKRAPPRVVKPFPISSQDKEENCSIDSDIIERAPAIANNVIDPFRE